MRTIEGRAVGTDAASPESDVLRIRIGADTQFQFSLDRAAERALLEHLLARLQASAPSLETEHLLLKPCAVDRFLPPLGGVGLRFQLDPGLSLHLVLPWSMAQALVRLVQTFHEDRRWGRGERG